MSDERKVYDRIWLQYDPDETTWCQDKIHDDDVAYVRVDSLAIEPEMVDAVKGAIGLCTSHGYGADTLYRLATALHEILRDEEDND
jgi:hypothetical protein